MPTYREPADPPSGLVDSTALAATVAELEAAHQERTRAAERRAEASRREAARKAAEKAARKKPRVFMRRDSDSRKKMMPQYGDANLLEVYCDKLTVCDVNTLERFGEAVGIRVS